MGDSISSWLQNMFGGNNGTQTVPMTPNMAGIDISKSGNNPFQTPNFNSAPSGLQYGQFGLSALGGLANGIMGFQSLGLAKKQMNQAQENWDKQWEANKTSTNAALSDRQRARVASNPGAYESVDSYMKKYGI